MSVRPPSRTIVLLNLACFVLLAGLGLLGYIVQALPSTCDNLGSCFGEGLARGMSWLMLFGAAVVSPIPLAFTFIHLKPRPWKLKAQIATSIALCALFVVALVVGEWIDATHPARNSIFAVAMGLQVAVPFQIGLWKLSASKASKAAYLGSSVSP